MKNNLLKTVSIGICAYNEEKNIFFLLKDVLNQERKNYSLKEIIVYSDGSTDKTNSILKKASKRSKAIKVLIKKSRLGKAQGLNTLFKNAKSEILITIDADVRIRDKRTIDNLVKSFRDKRVGLVCGNVLPDKPASFFQTIVVTYENFWKKTVNQIKDGNNIHNSLGCMVGLKRAFYSTVVIPKDIVAEDHFLYLSASKKGFDINFAKDAIVYYKSPKNIKDYMSQASRYFSSYDLIEKYFGDYVDSFYQIPTRFKLRAYILSLAESPFFMTLALFLQIYQRIFINKNLNAGVIWEVSQTSK